jgi:hypothetical protein
MESFFHEKVLALTLKQLFEHSYSNQFKDNIEATGIPSQILTASAVFLLDSYCRRNSTNGYHIYGKPKDKGFRTMLKTSL